jgi:hypothetical protein
MKKLLGTTLAVALLVPAIANAELLKNLKVSGSLEVDAVDANNVTDFKTAHYDTINTIQTRLMVHTDWDVLDDVHAHLSLDKNDRTYGTGSAANGSQDLNTIQSNILVDESYVKVDKVFGAIDATIGRQYYGEAGDLVIYFGPKYNLYGMPVTALDGGRLDWNGEHVGVTLLGAKVKGSALSTGVGGISDTKNIDLAGLDIHAKPTDNISGAAYVYDRTTINSGQGTGVGVVGNDYLYVAGLKAKVTLGGAWAKAEFDKDFGSNRTAVNGFGVPATNVNYTGTAVKLDLGDKVDVGVANVTGWGQYGLGSGGATTNRNFQSIAGDYRPGGIWGRFLASNAGGGTNLGVNASLGDLQVIGLGVKATPAAISKLTAGIAWYNYRLQNQAGANALATSIAGAPTTASSKQLGNEADVDLTWQHSENVAFSLGWGDFQQNGFVKGLVANSSPATLWYADMSVKF